MTNKLFPAILFSAALVGCGSDDGSNTTDLAGDSENRPEVNIPTSHYRYTPFVDESLLISPDLEEIGSPVNVTDIAIYDPDGGSLSLDTVVVVNETELESLGITQEGGTLDFSALDLASMNIYAENETGNAGTVNLEPGNRYYLIVEAYGAAGVQLVEVLSTNTMAFVDLVVPVLCDAEHRYKLCANVSDSHVVGSVSGMVTDGDPEGWAEGISSITVRALNAGVAYSGYTGASEYSSTDQYNVIYGAAKGNDAASTFMTYGTVSITNNQVGGSTQPTENNSATRELSFSLSNKSVIGVNYVEPGWQSVVTEL